MGVNFKHRMMCACREEGNEVRKMRTNAKSLWVVCEHENEKLCLNHTVWDNEQERFVTTLVTE